MTPALIAAVAVVGLLGAIVTSVAGFGGGMLLTLALMAVVSPHQALALAAPALMLGHSHRLTLLYRDVSWRHVGLLWLGALPVGGVAAMLAVNLPHQILAGAVVLTSLVGLLAAAWPRALRAKRGQDLGEKRSENRRGHTLRDSISVPAGGAVLGLLVSTTGIGGPVMPATLMSAGVSGVAFVATATACAIGIHVVRIVGYSAAGMMDATLWPAIVAVSLAAVCGNLIGRRIASELGDRSARWITSGLLLLSATLAVVKLA